MVIAMCIYRPDIYGFSWFSTMMLHLIYIYKFFMCFLSEYHKMLSGHANAYEKNNFDELF